MPHIPKDKDIFVHGVHRECCKFALISMMIGYDYWQFGAICSRISVCCYALVIAICSFFSRRGYTCRKLDTLVVIIEDGGTTL